MIKTVFAVVWAAFLLFMQTLQAAPDAEMVYQLKGSVAKIHVTTQKGGQGVGSGVVVANDMVATNCHVLANATDVRISKFGDSMAPIGLKADWAHDICILTFKYLELKPAVLGDSEQLQYEEEVFSIGFPGGVAKPMTSFGYVKALYPYEDATIIRSSASFIMGSSGSPLFNQLGQLVAISTFKSPGKGAYYYNLPIKWVKALINSPEITDFSNTGFSTANQTPFWAAPSESAPYFMQVVYPYQNGDWHNLATIAKAWLTQTPNNAEAYYYLGVANANLEKIEASQQAFNQALVLQPNHTASLMALGLIAQSTGDVQLVNHTHEKLLRINALLDEEFTETLATQGR
jgi:serine protease Do